MKSISFSKIILLYFLLNCSPLKVLASDINDFKFVEVSKNQQSKGYGPFCIKMECKVKKHKYLKYKKYQGTHGKFVSDRYDYFNSSTGFFSHKVKIDNGKTYYLQYPQLDDQERPSGFGERYTVESGMEPLHFKEVDNLAATEIEKIDVFNYSPGDKEQFVMMESSDEYPRSTYRNLCKVDDSNYCADPMPYNTFVGMKGYFNTSEPYKVNKLPKYSFEFFNVTMENGENLIYIRNDLYGKYGLAAEMIPLEEYEAIKSFKPHPIFPGSEITIEKKEGVYGHKTLHFSNGNSIREKGYEMTKSFVESVNGDYKIFELLIDNHISYDQMDDVYKIQRIGSGHQKRMGLSINVTNGVPSLLVEVRYYGDDWLFVDSFKLAADDYRYQSPKYEFNRDNSSGSVWEWTTLNAESKQIEYMKALSGSKLSTIRFYGSQYYSDLTLKVEDKKHIKDFLTLFESLKLSK